MAISKSIELGTSGVFATYWQLYSFSVDLKANITKVKMAGYVDQAARLAGDGPLMEKIVIWTGSNNPITLSNIIAGTALAAAYTKIVLAETNPFSPPNPFEGGTQV